MSRSGCASHKRPWPKGTREDKIQLKLCQPSQGPGVETHQLQKRKILHKAHRISLCLPSLNPRSCLCICPAGCLFQVIQSSMWATDSEFCNQGVSGEDEILSLCESPFDSITPSLCEVGQAELIPRLGW